MNIYVVLLCRFHEGMTEHPCKQKYSSDSNSAANSCALRVEVPCLLPISLGQKSWDEIILTP